MYVGAFNFHIIVSWTLSVVKKVQIKGPTLSTVCVVTCSFDN